MDISTIKKSILCGATGALALISVAQAQSPTTFGGRSQFRTWSLGVNGGVTLPTAIMGNEGPLNHKVNYIDKYKPRAYYGLTVRKQFSSWFGLELAANRGKVFAYNEEPNPEASYGFESAEADFQYAASINTVFQLATIDFLRRKNAVNFFATLGYGYYELEATQYADNAGNTLSSVADRKNPKKDCETYIPVGVGVKFKLSDRIALNLGHTVNFLNTRELYGIYPGSAAFAKDRFSYTYPGLELSLGSSSKEDLTWTNPVSTAYDELKDPAMKNELEALKRRVSALESTVAELSKDSDGDGVSDKFDKCPNTPAGVQVDGSGCPIKFPEAEIRQGVGVYQNIQFEFDSSVLKTESYAILDKLSSDLRATGATIRLDGHASAEGSEAYNLQLSKDRANSVKNYLVNSGVDANKITVTGHGESAPVASNATEAGRIQNRRVEIK